MNTFDIIGPIMVGPSSSHTAGVVRIGNVVHKMIGGAPAEALIKFHGSFSTTYRGHGSDKAIIGGLMGFHTYDERIRDSLKLAEERGMRFAFETVELQDAHPNTLVIEATAENGQHVVIVAESVGGGNILIRKINGIDVKFDGQYDTLIIDHEDKPGAIGLVTNVLGVEHINIARMEVYRAQKGGDAIMIIEADGKIDDRLPRTLEALPHIKVATAMAALES